MTILVWPHDVLAASEELANIVPFSRSGGRSLGGLDPATRTDRGWWAISLNRILLHSRQQRRTWNAIRQSLGGRAGLIAVPIWSHDAAPWPGGNRLFPLKVPHSDGATFSDGSFYRQRRIVVTMVGAAAIGATSCTLRIVDADADLSGVRFSYEHAAYETGPATLIDGNDWTVPIFPACRAPIPAGADLEFDMPTCLCRLTDDSGMPSLLDINMANEHSVAFAEAVDYWSDLAAGLI